VTSETKPFDFKQCPWCGGGYRDRQVLKVECDNGGPCRLFLRCDCGTVYKVERVISWRAEKVTGEEPVSQEIADFFEDWEKRISKARRE
jgi:hypothetical protein